MGERGFQVQLAIGVLLAALQHHLGEIDRLTMAPVDRTARRDGRVVLGYSQGERVGLTCRRG